MKLRRKIGFHNKEDNVKTVGKVSSQTLLLSVVSHEVYVVEQSRGLLGPSFDDKERG